MNKDTKVFAAILAVVVAAAVVIFLLYSYWPRSSEETTVVTGGPTDGNQPWQEEKQQMEEKIQQLEEQLAQERETVPVPEPRLANIFGADAGAVLADPGAASPEALDQEVADFFSYLDKQAFVRRAGLPGGTYAWYREMVTRLSENPPLIQQEKRDIYALKKNEAHFYRMLGKKNLLLAQAIIRNEADVLEPVSAVFYAWAVSGASDQDAMKGRPSEETMYEYAAFFLKTYAGRSYLFRRTPEVRTLVTYYSILALDRANKDRLNKYGLDIRPYVNSCIDNLRKQKGLMYTQRYLDSLEVLKQEYAR